MDDHTQSVEIAKLNANLAMIISNQDKLQSSLDTFKDSVQLRFEAQDSKLEARRLEFDRKYAPKWVEKAIVGVITTILSYFAATSLPKLIAMDIPITTVTMEYPTTKILKDNKEYSFHRI